MLQTTIGLNLHFIAFLIVCGTLITLLFYWTRPQSSFKLKCILGTVYATIVTLWFLFGELLK